MSHRKAVALLLLAGAFSSLGLVTGCAEAPPARGVVYVDVAPPVEQIEVVGVAPSGEHVWIRGHYSWSGSAYVWLPGRWEVRPRVRARWVPGGWRRYHRRWYWVEGHWR